VEAPQNTSAFDYLFGLSDRALGKLNHIWHLSRMQWARGAFVIHLLLLSAGGLVGLAGCGLFSSTQTSTVTYWADGTSTDFEMDIGYLANRGPVRLGAGPDELPWQFTFEAERGQSLSVSAGYRTDTGDTALVSIEIDGELFKEDQVVGRGLAEVNGQVP
jgi:hypothetical protein